MFTIIKKETIQSLQNQITDLKRSVDALEKRAYAVFVSPENQAPKKPIILNEAFLRSLWNKKSGRVIGDNQFKTLYGLTRYIRGKGFNLHSKTLFFVDFTSKKVVVSHFMMTLHGTSNTPKTTKYIFDTLFGGDWLCLVAPEAPLK